jgi:hypothetical protein
MATIRLDIEQRKSHVVVQTDLVLICIKTTLTSKLPFTPHTHGLFDPTELLPVAAHKDPFVDTTTRLPNNSNSQIKRSAVLVYQSLTI